VGAQVESGAGGAQAVEVQEWCRWCPGCGGARVVQVVPRPWRCKSGAGGAQAVGKEWCRWCPGCGLRVMPRLWKGSTKGGQSTCFDSTAALEADAAGTEAWGPSAPTPVCCNAHAQALD